VDTSFAVYDTVIIGPIRRRRQSVAGDTACPNGYAPALARSMAPIAKPDACFLVAVQGYDGTVPVGCWITYP